MSSDPSVSYAATVDGVINPNDLVFGRTVVPVVNRNKELKKDKLGFEYAEHCFIGDAITLTLANGHKVAASGHKFKLKNQLSLTYGQINGLAGDFYGTYDPISDGKDVQDRSSRFVRAYNTLADRGPCQPKEAMDVLAVLQTEVDAVNTALANHQDPSVAYSKLPDVSLTLEKITFSRKDMPGYLGLAQINWDHFGADARNAYISGHATAIQKAISGDLEGAYAMNAFADHFLEDCFSAGHIRTPRRFLHRSTDSTADLCAKYMHDEDNAIGISVTNPRGQSWTMYGDKRALDAEDKDNKEICVDAVQASADEIYKAYQTKQPPSSADYQAWTYAPTLESARANQMLAPLFTFNEERRKVVEDRRRWDFKTDWWFFSTVLECKLSGLWKYPIVLNRAQKTIPCTSIAATSVRPSHMYVFYQIPGGDILQNEHRDGFWTGGPGLSSPILDAVLFTPLAAINFDDGNEIRVYYLDGEYILQEYCYSANKGTWFPGTLGDMKIHAATNTSIAATQFEEQGRLNIRVYCQELKSDNIREFIFGGNDWERGTVLPVALRGSSLAAVTYLFQGRRIRLYYQTDDLSIKEQCFDINSWALGGFDGGKAPGCVPISAVGYYSSDNRLRLHVWWSNLQNEIVGRTFDHNWRPVDTVFGILKAGAQLAAIQADQGKVLRLYYQHSDDSVLECCNDGNDWFGGANIGSAH